ncbi:two-component system sensor histidine kinase DesK [Kitasatospora viridis]|uniref:Two-component system sensor histidine kinase DesK n=1 Tax=Kitasatospora viridis TaxID=281105 RepID=A0A561UHQ6_9ACTN|nr:two-component system sensor histidine kinase DesK [Kitasatospora viridis]
MTVRKLMARWRGNSKAKRVEIYNRWSMYSLTVMLPVVLLPSALLVLHRESPGSRGALIALTATVLLNSVLSVPLVRSALASQIRQTAIPVRLLAVHAVTTQLGIWLTLLLGPHTVGRPKDGITILIFQLTVWVVAPAIALRPRRMLLCGVPMLLLAVPPLAIGCESVAMAVGVVVGSLPGLVFAAASCRCASWVARTAWELDRAREDQSRLAVAEERLRFSRDLHDVLGRNLTTMALKAELAVQLARRGRPEAVDQMIEVQRIAQQSHREVREVVRGYRTADLGAELAGARSVLRAAGIDCRVEPGPDPAALPPLTQAVLGWVVREAATNVLRHSEAGLVAVRLRLEDRETVLEVTNDGVPAEPPTGHLPGSGLTGLRERLAALGGELDCERGAGGRFTLRAVLPVRQVDGSAELDEELEEELVR